MFSYNKGLSITDFVSLSNYTGSVDQKRTLEAIDVNFIHYTQGDVTVSFCVMGNKISI